MADCEGEGCDSGDDGGCAIFSTMCGALVYVRRHFCTGMRNHIKLGFKTLPSMRRRIRQQDEWNNPANFFRALRLQTFVSGFGCRPLRARRPAFIANRSCARYRLSSCVNVQTHMRSSAAAVNDERGKATGKVELSPFPGGVVLSLLRLILPQCFYFTGFAGFCSGGFSWILR